MLELARIESKFIQLGGTWAMQESETGTLEGHGNLDDIQLRSIERNLGLDREIRPYKIDLLEKRLAHIIYQRFKSTKAQDLDSSPFASWCPAFHENVKGVFLPVASWDSSNFRPALVAPAVMYLLEEALKDPNIIVTGAQGTDTADVGALPIVDAFVFDTSLPAFIFTGSDQPHTEEGSDAPKNFENLSKLAKIDLRNYLQYNPFVHGDNGFPYSGVFWPYHNNLYHITDLVKVSPDEGRKLEEQTTFFSPNARAIPLNLWPEKEFRDVDINWPNTSVVKPDIYHITTQMSFDGLYDALSSVYTIDLGNQNRTSEEVRQILNPKNKAIVIAAHALGNVNNPIRWACVKAANQGKIVIDASRCLVGTVNERYSMSLLKANRFPRPKGRGSLIFAQN